MSMHFEGLSQLTSIRRLQSAALVGWLLFTVLVTAEAKPRGKDESLAEIEDYGQKVILQTPFRRYDAAHAVLPGAPFSMTQLTPKPDDPLYGSHSVDVIVIQDGLPQGISITSIAAALQAKDKPFCQSLSTPLVMPEDMFGAASFDVCPARGRLGGDLAIVQAAFYGANHIYVVIWTELVREVAPINPRDPKWQKRVAQILPKYFCKPATDNTPAMNCVSPKKMQLEVQRQGQPNLSDKSADQ